jgi:26S proteasome regulatory subunit N10
VSRPAPASSAPRTQLIAPPPPPPPPPPFPHRAPIRPSATSPEVLVTHTKDLGQILSATHAAAAHIHGAADLPTAISIAQLALKHRQNKNLRQRVLVFVGSPLAGAPGADERAMVRLAKKLKKNNVAVDVVAFGDGIEEGPGGVLRAFVDAANSGDNS